MPRRFAVPALLCASLLMTGCGGGGSVGPPAAAPPVTPASAARAAVTFSIAIPGRTPGKHGRLPAYISSQTSNATIVYTPSGGTPAPPVYANCQATCTASFTANVGVDSFDVTLYDKDEKALSHGITTAVVDASLTNSIHVTFNGIVHDAALRMVPASLPAGTAATALLFVDAHDADGATIVTDGTYADANGAQVLFSVYDADTTGTTSINVNGVTAPGTVIPVTYNGGVSYGAPFQLATTSSLPGAVTGTTLGITPTTVFTYPLAGFGVRIINGDAGHYYGFTTPLGGPLSARRSPQSARAPHAARSAHSVRHTSSIPGALFACCDNATARRIQSSGFPAVAYAPTNQWLYNGDVTIDAFTTGGVPTASLSALPNDAQNELVDDIAVGPGPALYFTSDSDTGDAVGYTDLNLTGATELAVPSGTTGIGSIVAGSDGNMWFVENSTNKVGKFTPPGAGPASVAEIALPGANDRPYYIVDSPLQNAVIVLGIADGNPDTWSLWKIGYTAGNPASANGVSVFRALLPAGTNAFGFYALHATGGATVPALWTIDGSTGNFVRVDMASKAVTEFAAVPGTNPYLVDFAFAPDGSVYYVGQNLSGVGKLVP